MKADIDEFVADYRDDALFVAPPGTKTGKDGVRQAFQEVLAMVPDAKWDVPVIVIADDLLLIE
jgi:ketosteroid isomerase-like protein